MQASQKMTRFERKAVMSLAAIMALRMIGLFMVVPLFTLFAHQLSGATPTLIGLSIGIYGLSQAIFQLPFGILSDRFGRKPIILLGLLIFAAGSLLCGFANSMTILILGRTLQGAGAVGSTILATIADFTREDQRTKSMAILGITIGFSFGIAMVLGPVLAKWLPINEIFFVAFFMSLIAITLLYLAVPKASQPHWHADCEPELKSFLQLLFDRQLSRLNLGIFILHAIFTASFVVIPIQLMQAGFSTDYQWMLYLPVLFSAFIFSLVCMGLAERKRQMKFYFLIAIIALLIAEFSFWLFPNTNSLINLSLILFFTSFTMLEGFLPSFISRMAPPAQKGSAMGIFSCAQFLGIFVGGLCGGWLYGQFHFAGVYCFSILLLIFWFSLAFSMQVPRQTVTQILKLNPKMHWEMFAQQLQSVPGMLNVTFVAKENALYLKFERETIQHPDFLRLKEQLQSS